MKEYRFTCERGSVYILTDGDFHVGFDYIEVPKGMIFGYEDYAINKTFVAKQEFTVCSIRRRGVLVYLNVLTELSPEALGSAKMSLRYEGISLEWNGTVFLFTGYLTVLQMFELGMIKDITDDGKRKWGDD